MSINYYYCCYYVLQSTEPETRFSEMTRKAQVVAERRAKLRALRDEYNREERRLLNEQQDLQQHARVMAAAHPESQLVRRSFAWTFSTDT